MLNRQPVGGQGIDDRHTVCRYGVTQCLVRLDPVNPAPPGSDYLHPTGTQESG